MNKKELTAQIEKKRKEVDAILEQKTVDHEKLLARSRELDQLINAYIALEP